MSFGYRLCRKQQRNDIQPKFCLFCDKNNYLAIDCRLWKGQFPKSPNTTRNEFSNKYKNKKYCTIRKMENHYTEDCQNRHKTKTTNSVKCFVCNEEGHFAKNCQKKDLNQSTPTLKRATVR